MPAPRAPARAALVGALLAAVAGSDARAAVPPLAEGLPPDDRDALAAIAGLDPPLRDAVLEVTGHPEVLVRVPGWRMEFDARLEGVLVGLDETWRARFEELARHPYLVAALLSRDGDAREQALASYPVDVRDAARAALREHPERLRSLGAIQEDVAGRVEAGLAPLAPDAREAFHRVLDERGLATLLLDHIQAAVRLGAAFHQDPAATRTQLAAIRQEVEAAREREAEERAAREAAARERARREAEREQLRRWRLHWGYGVYRYPYDVYFGRYYDPWYWGWGTGIGWSVYHRYPYHHHRHHRH